MLNGKVIGFIGAGNMGEAIIRGLVQSGKVQPSEIIAGDINPERLHAIAETYGIRTAASNIEVAEKSSIILIAVKPMMIDLLLDELAPCSRENQLYISIAAGIPIDRFAEKLHPKAGIVRVMPNTPASVLAGMTALFPGQNVSPENHQIALSIFECIGKAVTIYNESLMDSITGLSGSGPAFVLLMIESLSDAGVQMGISRKEAVILAAQTVYGTAKMLLETGKHPAELRDMVTTPGGTTIAGIRALENGNFRATVMSAVEAATLRSRQMGK
jgi:pyrroline-5-carboxylate reductase